MNRNDIVTIRPEYRESGEGRDLYLLVEEVGIHGSAQIQIIGSKLAFPPINTVHSYMLEPVGTIIDQAKN